MNDDTKLYYSNLFNHKNNLPHAPQTEHIAQREVLDKNHKYYSEKNSIKYENTLPLIKITRGSCPECDCKTYSYDVWRGEKVCPQCGLVLEEGIVQEPRYQETYKQPKQGFTWEEKQFLKSHGHIKFMPNSDEWLNNHNNRTIKSLFNQAQLNKAHQIEAKYILDTIGFKKLHSRATKPQIISAVIRYVLKQTKISPSLLRYNQGIFKDLLTPEVYSIVEQNINKYFKKIENVF